MKKPKSISLGLLMLACLFVHGQTTPLKLLSSAGETFKNSNYQLDWSIGELLTETYSGNLNMLTQGFHQGKYIITGVNLIEDLQLEITAFPNPVTDFVLIKIGSEKVENFRFIISDIDGKILQTGKFDENQKQINLAGKSVGTYLLAILSNKAIVKTFKIVKSN